MVVIKPYDASSLRSIEKAIRDSDLGVNPSNDGQIIRVVVPQLSEERRREMVKVARGKGEDARVTIRSLRRKAMEELHRIVRDGEAGEDEVGRAEKELQADRRPIRPPDRRAGEAQGSRAARGLMTASHPETPAVSAPHRRGKDRASGRAGRNLVAAIGGRPRARRGRAGVAADRAALVHPGGGAGRRRRHLGACRGAAPRCRYRACRCRCCWSAARRWCGWPGRSAPRPSRSAFAATALGVLLWRMRRGRRALRPRRHGGAVHRRLRAAASAAFATLMVVAPDGAAPRAHLHDLRGRVGRRRLHGRGAGGQAPDGAHDQPQEVLGGLRRLAGHRAWSPARSRHLPAARAVVGGRAHRRAARRLRHARRPHRVADQARPRDQGHGHTCCRATAV